MSDSTAPRTVLVVCYGNICRSPIGEYLLRQELERAGRESEFTVHSAGVRALVGHTAAPGAQEAAAQHGLSLAGHEARRLTEDMARAADHIIAMDEVVEEEILILTRDQVDVELWPVDDPYGGPAPGYAVAYDAIAQHVREWIARQPVGTSGGPPRATP